MTDRLCEKCKKIVVREINALGDVIKIRLESAERITEFADDFNDGRIKGAIATMKDMQDCLCRMAELLGL